jgi:LPPG:FO 2-phospho-L-lactate transferase
VVLGTGLVSWESLRRNFISMKITALAGGIGAAKFLLGLAGVLPPEDITIIANTGDDIELLGLRICPDIDTVSYTLAGLVNEETGWGISGDTFESLKWLARYGEAAWFNLGDRDLATHIYRTEQLRQGHTLTEVTNSIRRSLQVGSRILPMTDTYTPTRIITDEGEMHLQEYLIKRRCEPRVREIRYHGIEATQPAPGVKEAILEADMVVICPSNPFISIGPIMAVPEVRSTLQEARNRARPIVIAISPIVGGRALKGPAAEMLRDMGHEVSARGVAELYRDIVHFFVIDKEDAHLAADIEQLGVGVLVTDTIMITREDKRRLARAVAAIGSGGESAARTR